MPRKPFRSNFRALQCRRTVYFVYIVNTLHKNHDFIFRSKPVEHFVILSKKEIKYKYCAFDIVPYFDSAIRIDTFFYFLRSRHYSFYHVPENIISHINTSEKKNHYLHSISNWMEKYWNAFFIIIVITDHRMVSLYYFLKKCRSMRSFQMKTNS